MVNPDLNVNRNDPVRVSYDTSKGDERPIGVPQTKKDFKVLLRKDHDKEEEQENQGKQVKDSGNAKPEKTVTKKAKPEQPATKASIFSLSEDAAKKSAKAEEPEPKDTPKPAVETTEKPIPLATVVKLPEKEQSKTVLPNLYVDKGEKKITTSSDVPVRPKGKTAAKPETAPQAAPLTPDKEDLADYSEDDGKEEYVALNTLASKKKDPAPSAVVAYREPEPVPINNLTKSETPVERPIAPKELPSIFSSSFIPKKEEPRVSTKFTQEQPDLAYVNPMHVNLQTSSIPMPSVEAPRLPTDMEKLYAQMIDRMTILNHEGKTDTSIILKYPPLFDGANLKITSFESARGEFNITFENLKPEALKILQENSDGLKIAMQNKGFTVHIITATTQPETPIFTAEAQSGRESGSERQDQEQPREQQEEG